MIGLIHLELSKIGTAKFRSRLHLEQSALNELEESYKQYKRFYSPLFVQRSPTGTYELVKGFKRHHLALTKLGINSLDCFVLELPDSECLQVSLALHSSEPLNPIDRAVLFQKLNQEYNLQQAQIAVAAGLGVKGRSTVNRMLKLLSLSLPVQGYVARKELDYTTALLLLDVEEQDKQIEIAEIVIREEWSYRRLELYIRTLKTTVANDSPPSGSQRCFDDDIIKDATTTFQSMIGLPVSLKEKDNKLQIQITCNNAEDLNSFISIVTSNSKLKTGNR